MNPNIEKLCQIAHKKEIKIIGLMSGTSLDGLDVALCSFEGSGTSTKVELCQFQTIPYPEDTKLKIRKIFAKPTIDFQHLCVLNAWIGNLHAEMVLNSLTKWNISPQEIDLIASHGQTVFHAPKWYHKLAEFPNATFQIGDGDHIAVRTGIITISDFRQKHVAAGGEGAPLALYGDYFIFSKEGQTRILLNIGGIANFTFLPGSLDSSKVFSTDTGPGNTLLDAFALKLFRQNFDEGGKIASKGQVNQMFLTQLKSHEFFQAPLPKTGGPELFNEGYVTKAQEISGQLYISEEDLLATLTHFSAETIAETVLTCLNDNNSEAKSVTLFYSGGGAHNSSLLDKLKILLKEIKFSSTDELGISGDAKEAILFATLANEAVKGGRQGTHFGDRKSVPSVSLGKISFPL